MSLTGLNSVLALTVPGVFPNPVTLQGFETDNIFETDNVKRIDTLIGVDGNLSAGLVAVEKRMNIHIQSDSPSIGIFSQWRQAEDQQGDVLPASMTVRLLGVNLKFNCTNGYLTDIQFIPSVRKLIQPRTYTITWNSIQEMPI